ncbi:MAG: tetratricopeptide repeat protein [Planctomycetota bacterium]
MTAIIEWRQNRPRTFAFFALAWGIAVIGGGAGCKTMTTSQQRKQQRTVEQQQAATSVAKQSHAQVSEQERRDQEIARRARGIAARLEREARWKEATALLADKQPQAALDIVELLLAPPPPPAPPPAPELDAKGQPIPLAVKPPEESPPPMEAEERARVLVTKGSALFDLNQSSAAIEAFQAAVKLDPNSRGARINLGKLLFAEERFSEALEAWRLELRDGYRSGELLFLIAQAHYELAQAGAPGLRLEAARAAVLEALVESPSDAELLRWLSVLEFESGRFNDAIRLFEQILKTAPLDANYLELLANCYIRLGDYERATDQMEIAARVREPSAAMCTTLGDLNAAIGLPERAATWYLRAFAGDVQRAKAADRYRVGVLLAQAGRQTEAIEWLGTLRAEDSQFAEAAGKLGELHLSRGETEAALKALEQACHERPQDGASHLLCGDLYLDRKSYDQAEHFYVLAAGLPDTQADGLAGRAEVAYARGSLEIAKDLYSQALAQRPGEKRFGSTLALIESELRAKKSAAPEAASSN